MSVAAWGIVFDLDDTLYLERDYVASGFRAVESLAAERYDVPDLGQHLSEAFQEGLRADVIDIAWGQATTRAATGPVSTLVRCYQEHDPSIALVPDAASLLDWAAARGPIALISDGDPVRQQRKLDALGLRAWPFDPLVLTGALSPRSAKPSPDAFLLVQQAWEGRVARCVYVADNPAKDFRAPHAMGWTTVRARHPSGLHAGVPSASDVHHEVERLAELRSVLAHAEGG